MKIQAYLEKDTGAALLLASREQGEVQTLWIPRSVIPHLKKGPVPAEGRLHYLEVTIAGWWAKENEVRLRGFKEI